MNNLSRYQPVDCTFHDRLLHFASLREMVEVQYHDQQRHLLSVKAVLVDVYTRNGAEWVLLSSGETLRLDDLVQVAGFFAAPDPSCGV